MADVTRADESAAEIVWCERGAEGEPEIWGHVDAGTPLHAAIAEAIATAREHGAAEERERCAGMVREASDEMRAYTAFELRDLAERIGKG